MHEGGLSVAAGPSAGGSVRAVYITALYGWGIVGRAAGGVVSGLGDGAPFLITGMLASLSVMPVV